MAPEYPVLRYQSKVDNRVTELLKSRSVRSLKAIRPYDQPFCGGIRPEETMSKKNILVSLLVAACLLSSVAGAVVMPAPRDGSWSQASITFVPGTNGGGTIVIKGLPVLTLDVWGSREATHAPTSTNGRFVLTPQEVSDARNDPVNNGFTPRRDGVYYGNDDQDTWLPAPWCAPHSDRSPSKIDGDVVLAGGVEGLCVDGAGKFVIKK